MAGIQQLFAYIFDPNPFEGGGIPRLSCNIVSEPFDLFGKMIVPVPVEHGPLNGCQGYRIGDSNPCRGNGGYPGQL